MTRRDEEAGGGAAERYPDRVATDQPAEFLFSYGTLQHPEVQLDIFGRLLEGEDDILPGYTIDYAEIEDHRIVDLSGLSVHPIVRVTGSPLDKVVGKVLWVTEDELEACDEYEVSLYRRVSVELASGRTAWAYVSD